MPETGQSNNIKISSKQITQPSDHIRIPSELIKQPRGPDLTT